MAKPRTLANFVSAGNPFADGDIDVSDINDLTATAAELNILDGATVTTAELNYNDITTLGTVEASKVVTADANGDVKFSDNDMAIFGAGSDLKIYHDGTNNLIRGETDGADLLLQVDGAESIKLGDKFGNYLLEVNDNSDVRLSYGTPPSLKLATTATGIDVTGTVTADGGDISGEFIADSYNETYTAVTSTSNATTVNCETGNTFSHTLTENTTFTFSNPPASGTAYTMTIEIIQDAGASGYTVTWPASVDYPAATAPTLTATASAVDVFVFTTRDGGTNWYGFTAGLGLATPA